MPAESISVRKLREVLRLAYGSGLSRRQVAKSLSLSKPTVAKYLALAEAAGLTSWPLPAELSDDAALTRALFPVSTATCSSHFTPPDFSTIYQELKHKGVTLQLLWEEYVEPNPTSAYQYSRFCELYSEWRSHQKLTMRQTHRAGEKLFVDYAGQTMPIIDAATGEVRQAQIFVATLGASNYSYAEATSTQSLADWISSHIRAFNFFGGTPEIIVFDYVPWNIIVILCPPPLCGLGVKMPETGGHRIRTKTT